MFRKNLAPDGGMLFVFKNPTKAGFYMKNTYIPLSIAFISRKGFILDIQDMRPLSEAVHRPKSRYLLALEVNKGWFKKHNIRKNDIVEVTYKEGKAHED